jgi:hypothetical protein
MAAYGFLSFTVRPGKQSKKYALLWGWGGSSIKKSGPGARTGAGEMPDLLIC